MDWSRWGIVGGEGLEDWRRWSWSVSVGAGKGRVWQTVFLFLGGGVNFFPVHDPWFVWALPNWWSFLRNTLLLQMCMCIQLHTKQFTYWYTTMSHSYLHVISRNKIICCLMCACWYLYNTFIGTLHTCSQQTIAQYIPLKGFLNEKRVAGFFFLKGHQLREGAVCIQLQCIKRYACLDGHWR